MERLFRGLFAACGIWLGLGAAPSARADVQPILVGNDAMLSGGAVLASVKDAGAAWYNPAGLAFVRHSSVELSAKAFLLRMYDVEALSSVQLPDGRWKSAAPDGGKTGSAPAPASKARALTMATVLALRYSLGYGPFGTPDIDPRGNTLHNLPVLPNRGFQHEIGIHLGSGVHS